jgi:hypothetical protein
MRKVSEEISSGELEAVVSKFTIHAIEVTLNDSALILAFLRNVEGSLGLVANSLQNPLQN